MMFWRRPLPGGCYIVWMIWVPWRVSGLPNNAMSPSGGQMRLSTPRSTLDHNIVLSRGTLVSLLPLLLQFILISDQKIENTSETRIFLFLTKNKKYHWNYNILISDRKLGNTIETRILLSWKKLGNTTETRIFLFLSLTNLLHSLHLCAS